MRYTDIKKGINIEPEDIEAFTEAGDEDIDALELRDLVIEKREPDAAKTENVKFEDAEPGLIEPGETPARKMLKRDLDAASLARKEDAARTTGDFKEVKRWWKRIEANRMRKERYWEQLMSSDMFDWDLDEGTPYYMEDALTLIFYCPCEMHELVEHSDIYRLIPNATDKQKVALFFKVVNGWSTSKTAECHGTSERNVLKLIDTMLENLREELYVVLKKRHEARQPMTHVEDNFFKTYIPLDKKKQGRPKKEREENSDAATEKNKRGRPRKEPVEASIEKKKRGRPRKITVDSEVMRQ